MENQEKKAQYVVSFDLADAEVYIPSGRLMNLKHSLNWDDIQIDDADMRNAAKEVEQQQFVINTDFSKKNERFIENIVNSSEMKGKRELIYRDLGLNLIKRQELFSDQVHNITEDFREQIGEMMEATKADPEIQKRLAKLHALREINKIGVTTPTIKMK